MLQYNVKFDELDWEEPLEGIKNKIYKHKDKQIRLVVYTKKVPPHWCEKGHYGYILDGDFEIEFRDKQIIYKTGDGVFIPEGKEHKHRARALTENVKAIFIENV
jgi:quercetin dioxygenase-like cupin family protein